jgi:lipoate-protein ligase A
LAEHLHAYFAREFHTRNSELSENELDAAMKLVASKYSTPEWINRLP